MNYKLPKLSFHLATLLTALSFICRSQSVVISHVSVVPMNKDVILKDQTVILENGIIKFIGPAHKAESPKNASRIDGTNKFLMPGLFDMHMHFFFEQGLDKKFLPNESALMLANGITTARIMCGDPEYLKLRGEIKSNQVEGPELFIASPQLVGKWNFRIKLFGKIVSTPEEAARQVREFKKDGYDEIKITFFIKPDVYDAIIKTAREVNIKVTGHVGPDVKLPRALAAHQQIEHLDEFLEMLLPDTSYNHGISVSGTGIWAKKTAWKTVASMDESKIPMLVQQVKAANIYLTPTNYFLITCFAKGQTDDEIRNSPDFNYIPVFLKPDREEGRKRFWADPPPENDRKKYIDLRFKLTKALFAAGIKLMAGSDAPEWYLAQGFSLHNELEMFVQAGLSNFDALQTATINPATYLGIANRIGTIEVGKEANLILLDKNPLENIQNTRTIVNVFAGKRVLDENALKNILEAARIIGQ